MQKLFAKNGKKSNLEPTHHYYKIFPSTREHLSNLDKRAVEDTTFIVHTFPLDYEIEEFGDYYVDPEVEDSAYTYRYVVVPPSYKMPDVPYELLEKLYEPTDDEEELEAKALVEAGVMDIDTTQTSKKWWWVSKYRPNGSVFVENNTTGTNVPLVGQTITIGNWFWWRTATIDTDGNWRSPRRYRYKTYMRIRWRSDLGVIRNGIHEFCGILISDFTRTYKRSSNGHSYTITRDNDKLWKKATVHLAMRKYDTFARRNGLIRPEEINVWIYGDGSSSAPLFKQRAYDGAVVLQFLRNFSLITLGTMPSARPDIIIAEEETTEEMDGNVFHEFSHFSHAMNVNDRFWAQIVRHELSNMLYFSDPYANGTEPTRFAAQNVALAEGWAFFMAERIGVAQGYATNIERFRPRTIPFDSDDVDMEGWIPAGLFWDLEDNTAGETIDLIDSNGVNIATGNDLVSGFTINQMYQAMEGCWTIADFRERIIALRPEARAQIEDLFTLYGY